MDELAPLSGMDRPQIVTAGHDRRVLRTRSALRSAFARLILSKGYDAFTTTDIAEQADVGRSTFYEHYRGKEDMLAQSLGPVLMPLADCLADEEPSARLLGVVTHFRNNRKLARAMMADRAHRVLTMELARLIERKIVELSSKRTNCVTMVPTAIIAAQLASGQLAMINEWLSSRHGGSPKEIAAALHTSGRAILKVLA